MIMIYFVGTREDDSVILSRLELKESLISGSGLPKKVAANAHRHQVTAAATSTTFFPVSYSAPGRGLYKE